MRISLARGVRALVLALGILSCTDSSTTGLRPLTAASPSFTLDPSSKLRISQVYGAGGNSNALFNADYVELYNSGTAPADLTGLSLQYTSATGTGALGSGGNLTVLSGTVAPGHYYLVGMTAGSNGSALPAVDKTGSLNMAAGAGKVALVNSTTQLGCNTSANCSPAQLALIVDFVGYGNANFFEGSAGAPSIDVSHADFRKNDGAQDTDQNGDDFVAATPNPRNSAFSSQPQLLAAVAPTNPTVPKGTAQAFSVTASFGGQPDNITSVTWTSSVATVAADPVPPGSDPATASTTAAGKGTTVITASVTTAHGTTTASTNLTVVGVPASVTVDPATFSMTVGATKTFTATALDSDGQPAPTNITWSSLDPAKATVDPSSGLVTATAPGTVTIRATTSNNVTGDASVTITGSDNGPIVPTTTFVSEIHYDNNGTDSHEAIEIESPAGMSFAGWSLVLYDGANGNPYTFTQAVWPLTAGSPAVSAATICGNRQVIVVSFPSNGLQNGSADGASPQVPDGWALVDNQNHAVEFGSYEGTFVGASGAAAGFRSTDIGVQESSNTGSTQSLQRAGNGVWFGPKTNSMGSCNPATPPAPESIIIEVRGDPLPVGFQDQLFIDDASKDSQGNPLVGGVNWSSSDTSIVKVDSRGIITARANGSATITATGKTDANATGTAVVFTNTLPVSPTARVGHNTELGIPTDADPSDDIIIARRQYTLSFNASHGDPNWVSWNLDASHKGTAPRCDCFSADPLLPSTVTAYTTADWINGGVWSRGHMSPSADWNVSDGDNAPTFYLTNMLPQNQTLNSGAWGDLEDHLRSVAVGSTEIYIIAGGIFTKNRSGPGVDGFGFMSGTGHIAVPDSIWKIAIIVPDQRSAGQITSPGDVQVIAANFPNSAAGTGSYINYLTTIDKIQKSTGYDFLSALPADLQCKIEGRDCDPTARISGPAVNGTSASGNEGETLHFDASNSTDPDGDQLQYQWSVNGQTAGIGATLDYTFPNNGAYEVKVVVGDGKGGAGIATITATIANVAPIIAAFDGGTVSKGAPYAATGSFTDPGTENWTATVNYGDGGNAQPLTLSDKSFSLNHTYAVAGTFTVTVTVNDGDATATQTASVTVVNHPPVAHITGAGVNGGGEGTPLAFDALTSIDPDDGDVLSYQWSVDGQTTGIGSTLSHSFPDNGTYTVGLLVSDLSGASSSTSITVTVTNVAPTGTLSVPTSVVRGGTIPVSVINVVDKSSVDQAQGFTFAFDCATGAGYGPFGSTPTATCSAFQSGMRIVRAKIRDKDNGVTEVLASVSIVAEPTALVRHAPQLNGNIDGSLQMFLGESVTMNGNSRISGGLYVPGTPTVRLNGGPSLGASVEALGSAAPSAYTVTLNGGVSLGTLVRRTDAGVIPNVAAPAAPSGTRNVQLNSPSDQVGDWSTVRNVTLNGNVPPVAIPGGAYGEVTVNGSNRIVLGTPGITTVYNFQRLNLNGQAVVEVAGPVIVTVANSLQVNGPSVGAAGHPEWLTLQVAQGDLTLNGNGTVTGVAVVPHGTVTVNGGSSLIGGLAADRLALNGNGKLQITMGITNP